MEDYLAARKDVVGKQMRIYMDNYFKFDPEYSELDDAGRNAFVARYNVAQGGRVGLRFGTPKEGIKSLDSGAMDITYEGNEGPQAPMEMAGGENNRVRELLYKEETEGLSEDEKEELRQLIKTISAQGPILPSDEDPVNPFKPQPTGPVLPDKSMMAKSNSYIDYVRAATELGLKPIRIDEFESLTPIMDVNEILKLTEQLNRTTRKATGGRIGYRFGPGPVMDSRMAQPQGLRGLSSRFNFMPGPPKMAPDGIEYDMRENGGFQPLGAKEKKDDVKALLAKNEFVMTADAVRGAGGGDIELGAQRMYDTMKNLEKRVV